MNEHNKIGLHLRLGATLTDLALQAHQYDIKYIQFFLTPNVKNTRYIKLDEHDCRTFEQLREKHLAQLYIHSSYWINPAIGSPIASTSSRKSLKKEIALAKKLSINSIVLHPGCASGHEYDAQDPLSKNQGIKKIAELLVPIAQQNPDIEFLLENTTHGNKSIGSDLHDFALLRQAIGPISNINFCLDIAHAFAYGYDVTNIDEFITTLDQTMGLNRIKLIHLNDTSDTRGSKKDNHTLPGSGQIGIEILQKYYNLPIFKHLPKILELPVAHSEHIKQTLNLFL